MIDKDVGQSEEGARMKPISPFKFYGEDAPRKISSDPHQIVGSLMGQNH